MFIICICVEFPVLYFRVAFLKWCPPFFWGMVFVRGMFGGLLSKVCVVYTGAGRQRSRPFSATPSLFGRGVVGVPPYIVGPHTPPPRAGPRTPGPHPQAQARARAGPRAPPAPTPQAQARARAGGGVPAALVCDSLSKPCQIKRKPLYINGLSMPQ